MLLNLYCQPYGNGIHRATSLTEPGRRTKFINGRKVTYWDHCLHDDKVSFEHVVNWTLSPQFGWCVSGVRPWPSHTVLQWWGSLWRCSLLKWFSSSHWGAGDTSFLLQVVVTSCKNWQKWRSTSMRSQTYFMYFGAFTNMFASAWKCTNIHSILTNGTTAAFILCLECSWWNKKRTNSTEHTNQFELTHI